MQRAYRSLTYDPIKAQLLEGAKGNAGGTASPYQTARLASMQDALFRMQSMNFSQPGVSFFA